MQFMVRTEMHHPTDEMYETLHRRMAAESFSRVLTDSVTGARSHMPTGTYWTEAYSTSGHVMAAAIRAVNGVDANASITVSGGDGPIRYYNCPQVQDTLRDLGYMLSLLSTPKPLATENPLSFYSAVLGRPAPISTVPVPDSVGSAFWESFLRAK